MQFGENWFFFFKLKKKKNLPSPLSQAILAVWPEGESSATAVHGRRGGFLTATTTQQWAASFHAAISKQLAR
jgi:hypothetical protein